MRPENKVIIIPGLGDEIRPLELATRKWLKQDLIPVIHSIGWHDSEKSFEPKLSKLVDTIDSFVQHGDKVSLVGTSAGGSAALNAFIERKNSVHRVINVCGRLRTGPTTGFRSFAAKTKSSVAFAESVLLCESRLDNLTEQDKSKIMTVHALFGDELVPPETTIIQGAINTTVPTPEHILSIGASLTVFSQPLIMFLKSGV